VLASKTLWVVIQLIVREMVLGLLEIHHQDHGLRFAVCGLRFAPQQETTSHMKSRFLVDALDHVLLAEA
jgi:hypothetical protein